MEVSSLNIQIPKKYRTYFTKQEDKLLTSIMTSTIFTGWKNVTLHFNGKTAKQCRDRWTNYLAPGRTKQFWTEEEDQIIINSVQQFGTKWRIIKKYLIGRSDNDIKNRYYSHILKSEKDSTQDVFEILEEIEKTSSSILSIEDILNIKS
jgi:hypothetical protein